jgi:hypothetical protein
MLDAFIILLALVLIVLGARGTYQSIWNSLFPSTPIGTGPTTQVAPGTGITSLATSVSQAAGVNPADQGISSIASSVRAASGLGPQSGGALLPIAGNPIGVVPRQGG